MGKNEKKVENRCPVCGRFASKKVLDACKGMMSEVERTQKCEIEVLKKNLAAKEKECKELKYQSDELVALYNSQHDDLNKLKVENERLRERGFFDYLFGRG